MKDIEKLAHNFGIEFAREELEKESNEIKHTPGPWEVQPLAHATGKPWLQIGHNGRGPIARVSSTGEQLPEGVVAELKYLITDEEEQLANARLIAAAPELYDDVKNLINIIKENVHPAILEGFLKAEIKQQLDNAKLHISNIEGDS